MTITVNGVVVDAAGSDSPQAATVRELLRQRAVVAGMTALDAPANEADAAIERLLEKEVATYEPGEEECRRYYDGHPAEFASGELAFARHILFQVTPGAPVPAIRAKAELTLAELAKDSSKFTQLAGGLSNCPSGGQGGSLGQLGRGETVPEFEQALFNGGYTGIYPQLVKTRFGFHILAVDRREAGRRLPFDVARPLIAQRLRERALGKALEQYVRVLASAAKIEGLDLGAADSPLIQ